MIGQIGTGSGAKPKPGPRGNGKLFPSIYKLNLWDGLSLLPLSLMRMSTRKHTNCILRAHPLLTAPMTQDCVVLAFQMKRLRVRGAVYPPENVTAHKGQGSPDLWARALFGSTGLSWRSEGPYPHLRSHTSLITAHPPAPALWLECVPCHHLPPSFF